MVVLTFTWSHTASLCPGQRCAVGRSVSAESLLRAQTDIWCCYTRGNPVTCGNVSHTPGVGVGMGDLLSCLVELIRTYQGRPGHFKPSRPSQPYIRCYFFLHFALMGAHMHQRVAVIQPLMVTVVPTGQCRWCQPCRVVYLNQVRGRTCTPNG